MNEYQITIIILMSISGGIIGYLAARLQQEKNKVKLQEALNYKYKEQIDTLEQCRKVAGEVSYDTMVKKLNKDYTDGKIPHKMYVDKLGIVNRVYGRD